MHLKSNYCACWCLLKPPFESVPDPEMYFRLHRSIDNAVSKILYAVQEGNERLAVIIGGVGLGKTVALRMIIDSLEQKHYCMGFIAQPDMPFIELLKETIGQLSGAVCAVSGLKQILALFNQLLFKTRAAGKKVLIFIDEAKAMKPSILENLIRLTDMPGDDDNLVMIVLAGQLELSRCLEHPKRAHLFQRVGVYCRLTKIESKDLMRAYIAHRLERARLSRSIFTEEAYDAVWDYTENGVPRLINKICKLALRAGPSRGLRQIDAGAIQQIGVRFDCASKAIPPERRERVRGVRPPVRETPVTPSPKAGPVSPVPLIPEASWSPAQECPTHAPIAARADESVAHGITAAEPLGKPSLIADSTEFPENFRLKAENPPRNQRLKLASQLAAELLKRYPHLIQQLGSTSDPVPAWTILRDIVMRQLEQHSATKPPSISQAL